MTGTLQTATASAALVTGGASNDTVRIDAGATMLANGTLGDGADTLDVAGTLNTGAGSFDLNAGDDTFVIHDNTNVTGAVHRRRGQRHAQRRHRVPAPRWAPHRPSRR